MQRYNIFSNEPNIIKEFTTFHSYITIYKILETKSFSENILDIQQVFVFIKSQRAETNC